MNFQWFEMCRESIMALVIMFALTRIYMLAWGVIFDVSSTLTGDTYLCGIDFVLFFYMYIPPPLHVM